MWSRRQTPGAVTAFGAAFLGSGSQASLRDKLNTCQGYNFVAAIRFVDTSAPTGADDKQIVDLPSLAWANPSIREKPEGFSANICSFWNTTSSQFPAGINTLTGNRTIGEAVIGAHIYRTIIGAVPMSQYRLASPQDTLDGTYVDEKDLVHAGFRRIDGDLHIQSIHVNNIISAVTVIRDAGIDLTRLHFCSRFVTYYEPKTFPGIELRLPDFSRPGKTVRCTLFDMGRATIMGVESMDVLRVVGWQLRFIARAYVDFNVPSNDKQRRKYRMARFKDAMRLQGSSSGSGSKPKTTAGQHRQPRQQRERRGAKGCGSAGRLGPGELGIPERLMPYLDAMATTLNEKEDIVYQVPETYGRIASLVRVTATLLVGGGPDNVDTTGVAIDERWNGRPWQDVLSETWDTDDAHHQRRHRQYQRVGMSVHGAKMTTATKTKTKTKAASKTRMPPNTLMELEGTERSLITKKQRTRSMYNV